MTRLFDGLGNADWKMRGLIAAVTGGLSMLSMPPFFLWAILFLTFPVLVLLLDGIARQKNGRLKIAALIGWCFGFGYFFVGFYWVYHAFLVEGDVYGWLIPIVVPLLPAVLAVFFALVCVLAVYFWCRGVARLLVLALSFAVLEWLRGHIFTGFPWHSLGYSLTASPALMQSASVFGLYGLSILAVLIFSAPVLLFKKGGLAVSSFKTLYNQQDGQAFLAIMGLFVLLFAWGGLRLWLGEAGNTKVEIAIVQPNIVQKDKWDRAKRAQIVKKYFALTQEAVSESKIDSADSKIKKLVIWPESAMPFLILRREKILRKLADILPKNHILLAGNVRFEKGQGGKALRGKTGGKFYNSLLMFDDKAEVLALFDKKHLIPFGEYMPFKPFFNLIGLKQLANSHGAFEVGSKSRYIKEAGIPAFAPLLCYEVIFPDEVIEGKRPAWLLNVTNDAWYGLSDGPYQHLHYSKVRAVEQGLPLIRAANTGISAIINPYGQIVTQLGLGEMGIVRGKLPRPVNPTPYARYGDWLFLILLILGGLGSFMARRSS